jgi:hypothetical protein
LLRHGRHHRLGHDLCEIEVGMKIGIIGAGHEVAISNSRPRA